MKTLFKALTIVVLGLGLSTAAWGQKGSYLSVGGGLGMSGHQYQLDNSMTGASHSNGLGYHFGLGYSYFFHPSWGIGTAVYMSRYQTASRFDNYETFFENQIDDENDVHTLFVDLENWREQQKSWAAEVPLLVYYQHRFGDRKRHGIYAAAGAKVQFNVQPLYDVTDGTVTRSGYYPKWNVLLYGLPQHGFGTDDWRPSGDLSLKTSYAATGQLGALFGLTDRLDLLVGAYIDYGLNDIKKGSGQDLVSLDASNNLAYTNMIASNQTGRANLLSVGGTVTLRFRLCADPPPPITPVFIIPEPPQMYPLVALPPVLPVPSVPIAVAPPVHPTEKNFFRIFYQYAHADLSARSIAALDSVVALMLARPNIYADIKSYTCDISSKQVNIRVSWLRTKAVVDYLESKGISRKRFLTASRYYLDPWYPNDSEAHRAMNRRSEIYLREE